MQKINTSRAGCSASRTEFGPEYFERKFIKKKTVFYEEVLFKFENLRINLRGNNSLMKLKSKNKIQEVFTKFMITNLTL